MASAAIGQVNPFVTGTYLASTGSVTTADGNRVPSYAPPVEVSVQIQALTYNDILKLSGLNIQGVRSKAYVNGSMAGIVRTEGRGGDLLMLPDGSRWLVAIVLEDWPDWSSLALTRQL